MSDNTTKQTSQNGSNGANGANSGNGSVISVVNPNPVPDSITTHSGPRHRRGLLGMNQQDFDRIKTYAQMMAKSSFNASRNPLSEGDFFIIMTKGYALGFEPENAPDVISIIQGRPVITGAGMLALIMNAKQDGEIEDIKIDSQETHCTVTIKRRGVSPHTETFTMDDARRMTTTSWENNQKKTIPLAEKDNWKQQPRTMLKWRAITACARIACPDIIGGLYTVEEMSGDYNVIVTPSGDMWLDPEQPKPLPSAPKITPLNANNPKPPTNGATTSTDAPPPPPTEYDPLTGEEIVKTHPSPKPEELAPDDIRNHIKTYGADHWFIKNADAFFKMLRYVTKNQDSMTNDELSAHALGVCKTKNWKGFANGKLAFAFYCQELGIAEPPSYEEIMGTKPQSTTPAPVPPQSTPAPKPKAESKPQPNTPTTAPKPPQTVPAPTPEPTPASTDWHDAFVEWLWSCFDIASLSAWEAKSGKKITDYKTLVQAQDATKAIALANCWDILTTNATYMNEGRQTYVEFHSVFTVRMYGRSTEFKKQVGDEYYAEYGVGDWKHGGEYEIGLLKVAWKLNDKYTAIAHTVTVVKEGEDYPSDLTPEEEEALAKIDM